MPLFTSESWYERNRSAAQRELLRGAVVADTQPIRKRICASVGRVVRMMPECSFWSVARRTLGLMRYCAAALAMTVAGSNETPSASGIDWRK